MSACLGLIVTSDTCTEVVHNLTLISPYLYSWLATGAETREHSKVREREFGGVLAQQWLQ